MGLIIKISLNGTSHDYLFNKLGPIVIGSDKQCDLIINDSRIDAKVLEIKSSSDGIMLKRLSSYTNLTLGPAILSCRDEVLYREGDCVSMPDLNCQIHIAKKATQAIDNYSSEFDYKEKLEKVNQRIKNKEGEIRDLENAQEKRKKTLITLEEKFQKQNNEYQKLEFEVGHLKAQKESLAAELKNRNEKKEAEENRIYELKEYIRRLELEEQGLKEKIVAQNLVLSNLREQRELKSKEVEKERGILTTLRTEIAKQDLKLKNFEIECQGREVEITNEKNKIQKLLSEADSAKRESLKVQKSLEELIKKKSSLDEEISRSHSDLQKLEKSKEENKIHLNQIKKQIDSDEIYSRKIQEEIKKHQGEEENLKAINGDLRAELNKVEVKLSHKKEQLNQIEYQGQEAARKMATLNFELERANVRLNELLNEEKLHELKMISLRDEFQSFSKKTDEDKKRIQKDVSDEKYKLELQLQSLKDEIEEARKEFSAFENDTNNVKSHLHQLDESHKALEREKKLLEDQVLELRMFKEQTESLIQVLKNERSSLESDKSKAQRELSNLQIKLMDCETKINEKMSLAQIEVENYKREERSKIFAEKSVSLSEIEALKKKTITDAETEFRNQQEEIHHMRIAAQEKADAIISEARAMESRIIDEATTRLRKATQDAQERDVFSHNRIKEAQEYLIIKEREAEELMQKAKTECLKLKEKTDKELLEDLANRKQRINEFLNMKKGKGLKLIELQKEQHQRKMKKIESSSVQKIEDLRRKELKKVAKLREEEVSRQEVMKENFLSDLKREKKQLLQQIHELRRNQEAELNEKKKSMIEHINAVKFQQQKNWEEELKQERDAFLRSKKDRVLNATQAVMNVLVSETGMNQDHLRAKIGDTIEMAINGHNAGALKEMDQILDINPLKRKKMLPVLKKMSLRFGVPVAAAIMLFADIGSVRTSAVNLSLKLLKQQQSASEIYVNQQKNEWKAKHTFTPQTSPDYKATFTDNVVYTTDFVKVMENEEFQNDWILKVHDFFVKELELSEDVAINYISAEGTLVKELSLARNDLHPQHLEQGLNKLRNLESTHLGWLAQKIPDPLKLVRFVDFRKQYYEKFYNEKFHNNRSMASKN